MTLFISFLVSNILFLFISQFFLKRLQTLFDVLLVETLYDRIFLNLFAWLHGGFERLYLYIVWI